MFSILIGLCKFFHTRNMEKELLFVSGELNFFKFVFMHCLVLSLAFTFKTAIIAII